MFDYRDGVSWKNSTNSLAGGPLGGTGDGVWNRDAVPAEKAGFDCSKGHPAMGNYHHHQNPSAFKLDLNVISNVCTLYDADGLYAIDSTQHSPLIGFAYDGYPIYGAYGYANSNGTGGIVRMKSGFQLRSITVRNTYYTGASVTAGPPVNSTYPLGLFREDYEFITHTGQDDYLDIHNGRFCVTPEYPAGTYAYFATVDANWNSAYPYAVGPTFYGNKVAAKVTSITEAVSVYNPSPTGISQTKVDENSITVFPNPASDMIAVQMENLVTEDIVANLFDITGRLIYSTKIYQGSTMAYFNTQTLYNGDYFIQIISNSTVVTKKVVIIKE